MPQGRRKVPFSTKQKKQQLQAKRDKKREPCQTSVVKGHQHSGSDDEDESKGCSHQFRLGEKESINERPRSKAASSSNYNPNRYQLQFHREPKEEIERRKRLAQNDVQAAPDESLEIDFDEVFMPGSQLDMPKRPSWKYGMSKEKIDAQEHRYFNEYLTAVEQKFDSEDLSCFELNLETWRQLWRVLEMSDIVFIIIDIRFPALLMSPVLYDYITKDLRKDVVVILNKIDLAPPSLIVAWKHYVLQRFPLINVVCFTSFPGLIVSERDAAKSVQRQGNRRRVRMAAEGALKILEVCQCIVKDKVDLSQWKQKVREELEDVSDDYDERVDAPVRISKFDTHFEEYKRYKDGLLTIGFIGQPNVGKSSLLNALVGKKVVSVSKTPGHTKHFQTIFLTNNVRLCDCPGLVFPSKVPKSLQVLAGSYPIAHLQEPYSSIRFLAEHLNLPRLLKIRHPNDEGGGVASASIPWSPLDICDAWAEKRGFKTAKAARNDTYRAANNILRLALEGRICICLRPKGYTKETEKWESHPDIESICRIIARNREVEEDTVDVESSISDDDEEDSEDESDEREMAKGDTVASNKFALLNDE